MYLALKKAQNVSRRLYPFGRRVLVRKCMCNISVAVWQGILSDAELAKALIPHIDCKSSRNQ